MKHVKSFDSFTINENENNKWAADVDIKKGKMHKLLGIPSEKTISDVYTSGEKLAEDLLKATDNNYKEVAGMLAFPANTNPEHDIFDIALKMVKKLREEKEK